MICFAPVTEVFVFFYFNPMLASPLDAESSGAGVLSGWYLCLWQMVWVNHTMFLQLVEALYALFDPGASCGFCTCAELQGTG
jgi:hypothetical protein